MNRSARTRTRSTDSMMSQPPVGIPDPKRLSRGPAPTSGSTWSLDCPKAQNSSKRPLLVIINPKAGARRAPIVFHRYMSPIFKAAGIEYDVVRTQRPQHATQIMQELGKAIAASANPAQQTPSGIVIVGGDGLVLEVVSGLSSLPQGNPLRSVELAIAPGGTANAMGHQLYPGKNGSRGALARRCARAVIAGRSAAADVLRITTATSTGETSSMHGLSLVGWGLSGAIAAQAQNLRHLPAHRFYRYDLAGAMSLAKDWPTHGCEATLEYRRRGEKAWQTEEVSLVNLMAATVPELGVGRPFALNKKLDDGQIVISTIPHGVSRRRAVGMLSGMRHGKTLSEAKGSRQLRVAEFKLTPKHVARPLLVDGDCFPTAASSTVHVENLHRFIRVFATPDAPFLAHNTTSSWL